MIFKSFKFWKNKVEKMGMGLTEVAGEGGPDLAPQKFSGPLAAILKFPQKCKQTAVSQKLSKIKNFFQDIFCIS